MQKLVLAVLLSTVFGLGLWGQGSCEHVLQGAVSEDAEQAPIPFAGILLVETSRGTVSDSLGRFELTNICPGQYTLVVSHLGCEPDTQFIQVFGDLRIEVKLAHRIERLYFVNSERGRAAIEQINAGAWSADDLTGQIDILPARPNIFQLYESNIGQLTPMIADELKDAEQEYSSEWIEDAFRIAVQKNARNLRYIRAILERWRLHDLELFSQPSCANAEEHATIRQNIHR